MVIISVFAQFLDLYVLSDISIVIYHTVCDAIGNVNFTFIYSKNDDSH